MGMNGRTCAGALVVSGLFLASGAAWAERPAERTALAKQAEAQLTRVEERLAALQPGDFVGQARANLVQVQLDMAHKALERRNVQGARFFTDMAERTLAGAAGKGVQR